MSIKLNLRKAIPPQSEEIKDLEIDTFNTSSVENDSQYLLSKKASDFTQNDILNLEELQKNITTKLFDIVRYRQVSSPIVENKNIAYSTVSINLPNSFCSLQTLINEIIEDNLPSSSDFIEILNTNLIALDKELEKEFFDVEVIYKKASDILTSLENHDLNQQKYIYKKIATVINQKNKDYIFVSPEDGSNVESKYHSIVSPNKGQRILRGLSYILLDRKTEDVLKLGKVKTI